MRAVPKVRPYKNSLTLALSQREREFEGGFLFCRLIEWIERLYCRILNHLIQLHQYSAKKLHLFTQSLSSVACLLTSVK